MEIGDFNPNSNLKVQLDLAGKILANNDVYGLKEESERLAEYVIALDAFLRKHEKAYLPAAWIKPEEIPCPRCSTIYVSEPGRTGQRLCHKCEFMVDSNPNRQGLAPEKTK